jgi:hypothetical protein
MRCKRLDDLLPAYLDGDLPRRLNQRVSDHLDSCERCRQELVAQQRALRSLEAVRRPISIDLWADFSRRLQAQAAPRPSPWRPLWQPGVAAAMAAGVVALVVALAPQPGPVPAVRIAHPTQVARAASPVRGAGAASRTALIAAADVDLLTGVADLAEGQQQPRTIIAVPSADANPALDHAMRASAPPAARRVSFTRAHGPGPRSSVSY